MKVSCGFFDIFSLCIMHFMQTTEDNIERDREDNKR